MGDALCVISVNREIEIGVRVLNVVLIPAQLRIQNTGTIARRYQQCIVLFVKNRSVKSFLLKIPALPGLDRCFLSTNGVLPLRHFRFLL